MAHLVLLPPDELIACHLHNSGEEGSSAPAGAPVRGHDQPGRCRGRVPAGGGPRVGPGPGKTQKGLHASWLPRNIWHQDRSLHMLLSMLAHHHWSLHGPTASLAASPQGLRSSADCFLYCIMHVVRFIAKQKCTLQNNLPEPRFPPRSWSACRVSVWISVLGVSLLS